MSRLVLALLIIAGFSHSSSAQLLLGPGESYSYAFSTLDFFGDGYVSPNPRGFATFYSNAGQSTPGATFTVELFENDLSETPIGTASGSGFVTANAVNGWQDLQGVARVTVTSGNVFFDSVAVNVYRPSGFGDYELYSSGTVAVPEPATMSLCVIGLLAALGWNFRKRA